MNVAHIPMAIRENPPIGYYSYFTIADTLSKATKGEYLPDFDKTTIGYGDDSRDMLNQISWLTGQNMNHREVNDEFESVTLDRLYGAGSLEETNVAVVSCYYQNPSCGMTEHQVIENSHMQYVNNKHQMVNSNCCKLCGNRLETHIQPSLLLNIPNISNGIQSISTEYLRNNVTELAHKFSGHRLLLSRLRATRLSWNGYNIDNDFSNYVSLCSAMQQAGDTEILYLASHNTSFPIMGMIAVAKSLGENSLPNIVALPKLSFVDQENNVSDISIDSLRERGISAQAIRLVLLQSLGSNSHTLSLPAREFGMVDRRFSSVNINDNVARNIERLQDSFSTVGFKIPNRQILNQVTKELVTKNSELKVSRNQELTTRAVASIFLEDL